MSLPTSQVVRCWPLKNRVWHFGNPCAVFPDKRPIPWFWFSQALFRWCWFANQTIVELLTSPLMLPNVVCALLGAPGRPFRLGCFQQTLLSQGCAIFLSSQLCADGVENLVLCCQVKILLLLRGHLRGLRRWHLVNGWWLLPPYLNVSQILNSLGSMKIWEIWSWF